MNVAGPFQTAASTGGAGTSTGTVTTAKRITGNIVAVYVKYLDSPPAGTSDVTIATQGTSPAAPAITILSVANAATDGWFFPKTASHLNTSGAAISNEYRNGVPVDDYIVFTLAQANDNDYIQVWLIVE